MPILSSKQNERRLLSLLMTPPTHMRILNLDLDVFAHSARKKAAQLIQQYVQRYKAAPTMTTLKAFSASSVKDNIKEAQKVLKAFKELRHLPEVEPRDATFEFSRAENYRIGRTLVDLTEDMGDRFERGDDNYMAMRQRTISKLLTAGSSAESIVRGMVYDKKKIQERIEDYKSAESGKSTDIIPFGIKSIDDRVGGMRKSFVTLIYSKTGGGKTRTGVNIAFNVANAGFRVMYLSLEMAFNLIASCFDSRISWVDSHKIIFGKLDKNEKQAYAEGLRKHLREKLKIWIVDVSMGAKSSTVLQEIEVYKATHGVPPDLVIVDYANIMEPIKPYNGRSEKYDNLFQEYHEIAKYANVSLLTFTQESRDATKEDIEARKKHVEVEHGPHKIGLSNFMAPHVETIIRLKQTNQDKLNNRLWAIVEKSRYGLQGAEIPLVALWDKTYVGDKIVGGLKVSREKVYKAYDEGDVA